MRGQVVSRIVMVGGLAATLAGCGLADAGAVGRRSCLSQTTRAGLLDVVESLGGGAWGAGTFRRNDEYAYELALSDVLMDRFDPNTLRADCSAQMYFVRPGAARGIYAGRVSYSVQPNVDGGVHYSFADTGDSIGAVFVAAQEAVKNQPGPGAISRP